MLNIRQIPSAPDVFCFGIYLQDSNIDHGVWAWERVLMAHQLDSRLSISYLEDICDSSSSSALVYPELVEFIEWLTENNIETEEVNILGLVQIATGFRILYGHSYLFQVFKSSDATLIKMVWS